MKNLLAWNFDGRVIWILRHGWKVFALGVLLVFLGILLASRTATAGCDAIPERIASLGAFDLSKSVPATLLIEVDDTRHRARVSISVFGEVVSRRYHGDERGVCLTEHCALDQVPSSFVTEDTLTQTAILQRQLLWNFSADGRLERKLLRVLGLEGVPVNTRVAPPEAWFFVDERGTRRPSSLLVPVQIQVAADTSYGD